jgi:hypothetical protein
MKQNIITQCQEKYTIFFDNLEPSFERVLEIFGGDGFTQIYFLQLFDIDTKSLRRALERSKFMQ